MLRFSLVHREVFCRVFAVITSVSMAISIPSVIIVESSGILGVGDFGWVVVGVSVGEVVVSAGVGVMFVVWVGAGVGFAAAGFVGCAVGSAVGVGDGVGEGAVVGAGLGDGEISFSDDNFTSQKSLLPAPKEEV